MYIRIPRTAFIFIWSQQSSSLLDLWYITFLILYLQYNSYSLQSWADASIFASLCIRCEDILLTQSKHADAMGEDAKPEMPVFFCLDTWAKTPDATCLLKNVHKRETLKNFRDARRERISGTRPALTALYLWNQNSSSLLDGA